MAKKQTSRQRFFIQTFAKQRTKSRNMAAENLILITFLIKIKTKMLQTTMREISKTNAKIGVRLEYFK